MLELMQYQNGRFYIFIVIIIIVTGIIIIVIFKPRVLNSQG